MKQFLTNAMGLREALTISVKGVAHSKWAESTKITMFCSVISNTLLARGASGTTYTF